MKNYALMLTAITLFGGCAAMGLTPMGDGTVVTADGTSLPVADAVTAVGSAAGSLVGVPWVGTVLGGLATVFLSKRADKS